MKPGSIASIHDLYHGFAHRRIRSGIALCSRAEIAVFGSFRDGDAGAIRHFGRRRTIELPGLNDADLAFGKRTFWQAFDAAEQTYVIVLGALN